MASKKKAKRPAGKAQSAGGAKAKKAAKARARADAKRKPEAGRRAAVQDRRNHALPQTLRLRSVSPSFTVDDIDKSLTFYQDVLGFYVKERWIHDGKLAGAEVVAGGVSFFLAQDDWKKGRDRVKGEGFRVFCTTIQSIDDFAARIKSRGGKLLEAPRDQSWGTRDFAVVDPDGFKITFSSEIKKP